MKYFRMSYEEVVFRRSYLNILLLNHSIPSMNLDGDEDGSEVKTERKPRRKKNESFKNESELFASLM